ncbi:MAG TPA: response regulator transcription factor [Saprospiraceae bacterium]|nr:response regulator transcription factor [Saprospiraceae bacterium]HMQ84663.1 response regulator transcription factor [Saprospiraceae bacterium]
MIQLFIVDDHPMVIEGIRSLLAQEADITLVGTASDPDQALTALSQLSADVVLLDINLPDINGIELCAKLKRLFPKLQVLGMSTFKERSYISRMIQAGASGYVLKSASKAEIIAAIHQTATGQMYVNAEVMQALAQPDQEQKIILTAREKEVLACIANGLTNKEIADQLFISTLTVDSHRKNLLAKFGVRNTAALVKMAMERGEVF